MFGTAFTHPEFEKLFRVHRSGYEARCVIAVTERGLVLEGQAAGWQTKEQFKSWCVELSFVDEALKTMSERNVPMLVDPENPQDPEFIRESLVQLETVFAQQSKDLWWRDRKSWCKERFIDRSGSIACTELLPGVWLASQDHAGDALLICSAERFVPNPEVAQSSFFLQSRTTLAIRLFGFSEERRSSLWSLAWGDTSHQPEAEATRVLLRTLIHDREASGTSEDVLSKPVVPRPFWCQRYL